MFWAFSTCLNILFKHDHWRRGMMEEIKCYQYAEEFAEKTYRVGQILSYQTQIQCSYFWEIVWYDKKIMSFRENRVWLKFYFYHFKEQVLLYKTGLKKITSSPWVSVVRNAKSVFVCKIGIKIAINTL